MRVGGDLTQWVLLRIGAGESGEFGLDAPVGRVTSQASGVWESAASSDAAPRRSGSQPQASSTAAGIDGLRSRLSQTQSEPAWRRAPDLSVPAERAGNQRSGPGLVQRHHLRADGSWVHVFGGGDGLVEPVCAGLGAVQQLGQRVLHPRLDGGAGGGPAAVHLQHRPGKPVHQRGRWIDNRFIERLWRSVKQEDIYVQDYGDGLAAQRGLSRWFGDYNTVRPHQALGYATPGELYHSPESYGAKPAAWRWR